MIFIHSVLCPFRKPNKYGEKMLFGLSKCLCVGIKSTVCCDHRFYHNFNCINPLCSCGIEDETSVHFFLRCPHYATQRPYLLSKISAIISSDVTVFPDEHLYQILVYGSNVFNPVSNGLIITETITYIRNSGRFTNLEAFR